MNASITVNGVTYTTPLHAYQEQTNEIARQMYLNHYDTYLFSYLHDRNVRSLADTAITILLNLGVDFEEAQEKIEEDVEELFNEYYCSGEWSEDVYNDSQVQDYMESREI